MAAAEHSKSQIGLAKAKGLSRVCVATQWSHTRMSAQSSSASADRKGESIAMELSPRAGLEPGGHTPCRRASHEQDARCKVKLHLRTMSGAQHNLLCCCHACCKNSQGTVHKAQLSQHPCPHTYGESIYARQKQLQVHTEWAECLCPKEHEQRANNSFLFACRPM